MHHSALLFQVRMLGMRNTLRAFRPGDLPAHGASLIVFGGFAVAVFLITRGVTVYLLDHVHVGLFLMHRLLSMVLYVLFIAVNLGNVIVCYATFFRSEEVAFLMAMPVRHGEVFLVKFFDNFISSSLTLMMIAMAIYFGYTSVFSFPWHFYILSFFFVHLPLMLLAAIVAVGILVSLVAIASRLGVRRLLGLTVLIYAGAVYSYFKLTNPAQLVTAVMKQFPVVSAYFGVLDPPIVKLLPSHWVAEYLYWTILGETERALPYLLTLCGTAFVAGGVLWMLAGKFYYRSWLAASQTQSAAAGRRGVWRLPFLGFERHTVGSRQTDVVLKRDFWVFFRDPGQWVHLILMGGLLAAFLVSAASMQIPGAHPAMRTVTFLTLLLFNGFLVASIALRFVYPAVSLEGETFWCLRTAPVDLRALYRRKFLLSFVLLLAAAQLLAGITAGLSTQSFMLVAAGTISMGCVALTMTGLHLGAGAVFAQYREKNPIRVASSRGATLTFFLSMVYLMAVIVILSVPVYRAFDAPSAPGGGPDAWLALPLAVVALVSLAVTSVSSLFGMRSFCKDH